MKNKQIKKAFTMIELVFVIVIIGILASVAVPRLAATRDDAEITKARTLVASIRNAISIERQKRILRGNFTAITAVGDSTNVFSYFDNNSSQEDVLEYPMASNSHKGHWEYISGKYVFHGLSDVEFQVAGGKFVCVTPSAQNCKQLTN